MRASLWVAIGLGLPLGAGGATPDHVVPSVATPTLAAAIEASDAGDVIEVDASLYKGEVLPVDIDVEVDIQGANGRPRLPPLVIDGARVGLSQVWLSGQTLLVGVDLADLATVVLGPSDYAAAAFSLTADDEARIEASDLLVTRPVLVDDVRLDIDGAVFSGGADTLGPDLDAQGSRVELVDVRFEGSSASACGGAIRAQDSAVTGSGLVFDGVAAALGGGVCLVGGTFDASGVDVTDALATSGGFLWSKDAAVAITGLRARTAPGGVAATDGGVAWIEGGGLTLRAPDVAAVAVTGAGGVVYAQDAEVIVTEALVEQVQADGDGGVVWLDGGTLAWTGGVARQCAATNGSAVHARGDAQVLLRDVRLQGNDATGRGTVHGALGTAITVERSRFCGNDASTGSGVALEGGRLADAVSNTVFLGNVARDPLVGATISVVAASLAGASARVAVRQVDFVDEVVGRSVVYAESARIDVRNTIFHGEAPAASEDGTGPGISGAYDLFFAPGGAADDGDAPGFPGGADLYADPLFVGPTTGCDANLWLSPGSPARDSGDPQILDADGTRSDRGAFGGPDAGLADADGDLSLEDVDCDDTDSSVHPGAEEVPRDGVDQDCDGADLLDGDGDGAVDGDCDDADPDVFPGAPEVPYDGVDQDCDGADLDDLDGDGFAGWPAGGPDCDDDEAGVNPSIAESWYDGIDQDCDGNDDDRDLDGFAADRAGGTDCDDDDDGVHPGRRDIPNDAIDQDCDGHLDGTRLVGTGGFGCATAPPGGLVALLLAVALIRRRARIG